MNAQETINLSKYEGELLDIVYNQDDFTTSDLQGVIGAIVIKVYQYGIRQGKQQLEDELLSLDIDD